MLDFQTLEVRDLKVTGRLESAAEDLGTPNEATLSGNLVLTSASAGVQILNGGVSDRNVTLPAIRPGTTFIIVNSGATNKLVVKNAGGATIGNVGINQTGIVIGGAATWRFYLALGGATALTATVANLNAVPTATGTGLEIDEMTKDVVSAASTLTLSAGGAAIQTCTIQLKDADGNNIAGIRPIEVYIATLVTGGVLAAAANGAVSFTTGGLLVAKVAKLLWEVTTDINGVAVLSINNTGGGGAYAAFVILKLPNGKIKASAVTNVATA